MKLHEAIAYAIDKEGEEIIGEQRFVNYLSDLQAFEKPAVRNVMRYIVMGGLSGRIRMNIQDNDAIELEFKNITHRLAETEGYQENVIKYVLDSFLYAYQKLGNEPCLTTETEDNPISIDKEKIIERERIYKKDIEEFFNLEAEEATANWEATMRLSVKERIRKRKAIDKVFLDREYVGTTDEGHILLKVSVGKNLSDFKEGECLILHKEGTIYGIGCTLYQFDEDNIIMLDVFSRNMPSNIDDYYGVPLLLDKDKVDLRQFVYAPFVCSLPNSTNTFWEDLIINKKPKPAFDNVDECENILTKTIESFNLKLLSKQKEAVLKSMQAQDYYLIQGPPGTGKSFVLGIIMIEEMIYLKRNVIVIGPNHMVINNAMGQFVKLLPDCSRLLVKVGQSYNAPTIKFEVDGEERKIANVPRLDFSWARKVNDELHVTWLVGLTPHSLYTSRARHLECDTLIIDEAGQMTIPLALMGMIKAKKVIFAGDHKQLPPIVSSDQVKEELKQSVFESLITNENCTMLDTSFRMCEPICEFVSDLFYDGKLKAMKKGYNNALICDDPLYSFDSPVVMHEIEDGGEQVSEKEASFIADTIAGYISRGVKAEDIAVLSPFRAQAATIRRHVRKHEGISKEERKLIVSDTIDKMQGQERDVILYSLVSGNLDYMTEMAEFLYNPNKMNVAFSRAKSKLIIVGSLKKLSNLPLPDYPHINKMLKSKYSKII